AAAVPADDYWPAMAEVCRRHGVLLVADEVMTGFGRTGTWFGLDHWGVKADVLVCGKGSTSGYFPFGFAAASGEVFDAVRQKGFVHGFTWSHNGVGAAGAAAVCKRLREANLVDASRTQGERLLKDLASALADSPVVGDVRGLGLMVGIELVADRSTKAPFGRSEQVTERVVAAARDLGLLLYSSTGHVDGTDGDLVMLGPPFVATDEEIGLVHTAEFIDATKRAGEGQPGDWSRFGYGPGDNPIFSRMHEAGALVVGASLVAAQEVVEGRLDHAFNAAGGLHHAMPSRASGFCVYDDPAVAIAWLLRRGAERIAYVDVDVHHGDGPQAVFYTDPRVLTVSIHESGEYLFPGTGFVSERGAGEAEGTKVNVPLPPGTGDQAWLEAFREVVPPLVRRWGPDVLVTQL